VFYTSLCRIYDTVKTLVGVYYQVVLILLF